MTRMRASGAARTLRSGCSRPLTLGGNICMACTWQLDGESCAARPACHVNTSLVKIDELLDNCQADTGPAGRIRVAGRAIKRLPDARHIRDRHAWSLILSRHDRRAVLAATGDGDNLA